MNRRKAFTLVELMIVILVLGALAAIALPRLADRATEAKRGACLTNIATINSQTELYNTDPDNTGYPGNLMTDLLDNPLYFPDGPPVCPSGGDYAYINETNPEEAGYYRVNCTVHTP